MRILPAQRKMIAAAAAGKPFDASLGAQAKLRSKHNTFMAVPVVFIMLSNHFPVATYGNLAGRFWSPWSSWMGCRCGTTGVRVAESAAMGQLRAARRRFAIGLATDRHSVAHADDRWRDEQKRAEEVIQRCRKLATFSEDAGGTRRTFLCAPMRDCHREITDVAGTARDMQARVDAAGNWRAVYPGGTPTRRDCCSGRTSIPSPMLGAYDGVLGVVLAIALLEALGGRHLSFGIEVVGFSEEEGVRFGTPFIGSRALVGRIDEELLNTWTHAGFRCVAPLRTLG